MKFMKPKYVCDRCGKAFHNKQFIKLYPFGDKFDLCIECLNDLGNFLNPDKGEEEAKIGFRVTNKARRKWHEQQT